MPSLPKAAHDAWLNRERRMVFTTTDGDNVPNAIWILCAELVEDDKLVIADNAMSKTLANVRRGGKASLLYLAPEREAYQIKGTVEHHADGPVYDDMKSWLNPNYPGRSAVLLHIEEVYYGAERLV